MKTNVSIRFALAMAFALGAAFASAQALDDAPKKTPQQAFLDGERRIAFEMRKKPWNEVFEWLVDQTGLSYISPQSPPPGTFNFISPKGAVYSAAEVIDIINDGLLQHQYALIRRPRSFTIVSADQKIDPSNVVRVAPAELKNRGATELVQTVVALRALNADEYAPDVKRQMGPLGSVVALPTPNHLILQDTAGNLLRILETLDGIEKAIDEGADTFAYKCIHVKASVAEGLLAGLLAEPSDKPAAKGAAPPRLAGMHAIKADDRTNILFLNGRPNKIAQAKSYLKAIDQPDGQAPVELQTETVPLVFLEAAKIVDSLKDILGEPKGGGPYLVADAERNVILVHGSKEQVRTVKEMIGSMGENPKMGARFRVFSVGNGNAAALAGMIQQAFASNGRGVEVHVLSPRFDGLSFEPVTVGSAPQEPKGADKDDPKKKAAGK
jgi:type II secretory pathway component GspD/PulD (secretin)